MKIKPLPLALTAVLTAAVLFGSWFGYRAWAVEQPFERALQQIPGVKNAVPVVTTDQLTIEVELEQDAALAAVYERLRAEAEQVHGALPVRMVVINDTPEQLDALWRTVLFEVAEAMETRRYTLLPAVMEQLEQRQPGIETTLDMDEAHVYVTLASLDGAGQKGVKHIVLPRIPARMEVWPNA